MANDGWWIITDRDDYECASFGGKVRQAAVPNHDARWHECQRRDVKDVVAVAFLLLRYAAVCLLCGIVLTCGPSIAWSTSLLFAAVANDSIFSRRLTLGAILSTVPSERTACFPARRRYVDTQQWTQLHPVNGRYCSLNRGLSVDMVTNPALTLRSIHDRFYWI